VGAHFAGSPRSCVRSQSSSLRHCGSLLLSRHRIRLLGVCAGACDTREDLRLAIVTWIETKYNRRRRQRALGKLTPVEFEMIYLAAEAA
jgi:hypothetical protein